MTLRYVAFGRTPLDEGSARRRDLPDNTQHSQETDIHAFGGIRTRNPTKRTALDPRLRQRGHWDRRIVHLFNLINAENNTQVINLNKQGNNTCK
jgi:hypothetical protein